MYKMLRIKHRHIKSATFKTGRVYLNCIWIEFRGGGSYQLADVDPVVVNVSTT